MLILSYNLLTFRLNNGFWFKNSYNLYKEVCFDKKSFFSWKTTQNGTKNAIERI